MACKFPVEWFDVNSWKKRGRQNGCRGRLLQQSAIVAAQRRLHSLLLKAESAASEGTRDLKKNFTMHEKNGEMCFDSAFCIGFRVGRQHSEAVLTIFSSANNILLRKVTSVDLKLLQVRSQLLEFLGL